MRLLRILALTAAMVVCWSCAALAQSGNGIRFAPLGYCQMTSFAAATKITPATCTMASFTASGNGQNLTVSAVASGVIEQFQQITGTGVPAGTYIQSQISGVAGGAGIYLTSQATTANAATITAGGVPLGATQISFIAETQALRYRDDNQAPTATVGMPVAVAVPTIYSGSLIDLQFIAQVSGSVNNISFYKSP